MERVRWGLLSTAAINDELLAQLRRCPEAEAVAVASRDGDRAAAWAEERGIPRSHGSYDALLADAEVDVVYVSLPNGMHAEWTRRALEAGKHVLCEKPFTPTAAEAQALFDLAAERGLIVAEAVMYRHHPQTQRLLELVRTEVGTVRAMHASFNYPVPNLDTDARVNAGMSGGALRDLGSYCISLLNLIAGEEPSEVAGHARLHPRGADIGFFASMRYPDGVPAAFDVAMDARHLSLWLVVTGDRKTLRVPNPFQPHKPEPFLPGPCPEEAFLVRAGTDEVVPLPGDSPFRHEVQDVCRAVRGEPAFLVPAAETVRNMRTIDRLLESAGLAPQPAAVSAGSGAST